MRSEVEELNSIEFMFSVLSFQEAQYQKVEPCRIVSYPLHMSHELHGFMYLKSADDVSGAPSVAASASGKFLFSFKWTAYT